MGLGDRGCWLPSRSFRGRGAAKRLGVMSTVAVVIGAGLLSLGVKPTGAATPAEFGPVTALAGGAICRVSACSPPSLESQARRPAKHSRTPTASTPSRGWIPPRSYDVAFDSGGGCPAGQRATTSRFPSRTSPSCPGPPVNAAMATGGLITGTVKDTGGTGVQGICVLAQLCGAWPRRAGPLSRHGVRRHLHHRGSEPRLHLPREFQQPGSAAATGAGR